MIEHRFKLPDGRTLAAAEVGDPHGLPTFYFHGYPGSRWDIALGADAARDAGLRLIGFDRPGWGASDPHRGRQMIDWPKDIEMAANQLSVDTFNVVAVSGGGPFALACASQLPNRIERAGIICGLGPNEARQRDDGMNTHVRVALTLSKHTSWLVRPTISLASPFLQTISRQATKHAARSSPPCDQEVLRDPYVRGAIQRSFSEAFSRGGHGAIDDGLIYGNPWGFDLESVKQPVHWWHGERDRVVPVSMGRFVTERLPDSRFEAHPEDGHFSIIINHFPEIFAVVASRR